MTSESPSAAASGTVRPGGRTARTRTAVHAAVRELLAENGGLPPGIPEVAARSQVHTATIYRRWRTPEALMLDVAVDDVNASSPVPVTGDLRVDLLAYTTHLIRTVHRPGGLAFLHAIFAASRSAGETNAGIEAIVEPRIALFQTMLDAGGAAELTPYDLIDLILAPAFIGAMFRAPDDGGNPGDDDGGPGGSTAETLVDNALAVLAARRGQL